MTVSRLIARPMLASVFVVGSAHALRNAETLAPKVQAVADKIGPALRSVGVPAPSDPATLVRINAGTQIAAGLMLATGRAPRLSAGVLAATLVPATIAGHPFWKESDPAARRREMTGFLQNTTVLGGLLIAAGDTEGKPGLAWRARRVAKDARREGRHLAATARREAALAKAKVS
ncbi:DoxX family membrane protein [Nocardioides sp. dk4132]|uniref:DoxX family protein n=1 Tax=unclassified Nocardioides TaxID=2615069 RepID=UPI001294E0C6|nr:MULTISPECIES: DoxX family protein [unclassified Nocardioides]MQW75565.1 DoxX family membrane protein [Nocardioides sp. dk4132]QGA08473.1 DoxX family membrane protein [Nocardioides sp. dk884]